MLDGDVEPRDERTSEIGISHDREQQILASVGLCPVCMIPP
jgi:hypothetical protein